MNKLKTKRGERTNDVCETQNRADTDLVERSDVLGSSCIMKWKGQMYSAVAASWSDLLMELLQSDTSGKIPKFPLVAIADSLKMGDDAVNMCSQSNVESIICLGVDFMSESVSAILGKNGFSKTPVYRATHKHIGCSLAESAEGMNYKAWLNKSASEKKKSLHVVYINTSLETKATSSSIIPTITCTSSNVLQTILQASAQMGPEEPHICYGPDHEATLDNAQIDWQIRPEK